MKGNIMSKEAVVANLKANIVKGLTDYFAYVSSSPVQLEDFSDAFINRLAEDAYYSKFELREMMRKSPAWNEELQAWVINGNRTHEPDKDFIFNLAVKILKPAMKIGDDEQNIKIYRAAHYFITPESEVFADAVKELAPKANLRQKKSKVFGALCKALGVWEDGGEFYQKYSDLCNEFNQKKIEFKLYVSINPAHFLTMSNPHGKRDYQKRKSFLTNGKKETMTSCHSLTSEYCYKNGAVGYARDAVTMIAFTASDDKNPETLNYRKTNRQLFMYKVDNGVLLQSRLYTSYKSDDDSYGGVDGDEGQETSTLFRHLIQREICECEEVPNFWGKPKFYEESPVNIPTEEVFMGYPDWLKIHHSAKISIRKDSEENPKGFSVGAYSLGIDNGEEFYFDPEVNGNHSMADMLWNDEIYETCEDCGCRCCEDELNEVYDENGYTSYVCDSCLEENYFYCEDCESYHHNDNRHWVGSDYCGHSVCENCLERYYTYCEECEDYYRCKDLTTAYDANGEEVQVCSDCLERYYTAFEVDGETEYWHNDAVENGNCPYCQDDENDDENDQDDENDDEKKSA